MAVVDEKWNDKMMNKLLYMYKNDVDTDFELQMSSDDKPVKAHSAVLKGATNFFRGQWKMFKVPEQFSRRTVEAIVYFIYSGELPVNTMYKVDLDELCSLAKEFQMNDLEKRIRKEAPVYKGKKNVPKSRQPRKANADCNKKSEAEKSESDSNEQATISSEVEDVEVKIEPEDFEQIFNDDDDIAEVDAEDFGLTPDFYANQQQPPFPRMNDGKLPLPKELMHLSGGPSSSIPMPRNRKRPRDGLPMTSEGVLMKYTDVSSNSRSQDNAHATKVVNKFVNDNPHLVKDNVPVRLKIMDKKGDATQRIYDVTVKRFKPAKGPPRLVIKHHNENSSSAESNKFSGKCLPKGPWGCDKCMIPFDSYNSCRNHMTDVHKIKFDPKECDLCGVKLLKSTQLPYHKYMKHRIEPEDGVRFPTCGACGHVAIDEDALESHATFYHKAMADNPYTSRDRPQSKTRPYMARPRKQIEHSEITPEKFSQRIAQPKPVPMEKVIPLAKYDNQ